LIDNGAAWAAALHEVAGSRVPSPPAARSSMLVVLLDDLIPSKILKSSTPASHKKSLLVIGWNLHTIAIISHLRSRFRQL
jgi:hypothetical protein